MLIAQITDIHLGFEPDNPAEFNRVRLDEVIALLLDVRPAPDLLIISGDLTHHGDPASYRRLREALGKRAFPILPGVGNHDVRASFREAFPHVATHDGFVQYVVDDWPLRVIVVDTVEEGRHGGAFCEDRARWLDDRLAEAPDRPTLLALHHPPIPTGIDWMTTGPLDPWALRLEAVVSRHSQVVAAIAGHIHRPMAAPWAGAMLVVCPAVAPQVALDFAPMDGPDGRPLVVSEPAGFALHRWTGNRFVSHFATAQPAEALARYDSAMQPTIERFAAERES